MSTTLATTAIACWIQGASYKSCTNWRLCQHTSCSSHGACAGLGPECAPSNAAASSTDVVHDGRHAKGVGRYFERAGGSFADRELHPCETLHNLRCNLLSNARATPVVPRSDVSLSRSRSSESGQNKCEPSLERSASRDGERREIERGKDNLYCPAMAVSVHQGAHAQGRCNERRRAAGAAG